MISPETLSIINLKQAFFEGGITDAQVDENGCLQIKVNGKTFLAAKIGPHQLRFFIASSVELPDTSSVSFLQIANELNSDLGFVAGAYVSDEGDLIYTHPLTVSGGVSEWNAVMALNEFSLEHAIFEQVVEKRVANSVV